MCGISGVVSFKGNPANKECADEYMRGRIIEEKRTGEYVKCHNCSEEVYMPKNRIEKQERYFCCNECRIEWMKSKEFSEIMSSVEREKMDKVEVTCYLIQRRTGE